MCRVVGRYCFSKVDMVGDEECILIMIVVIVVVYFAIVVKREDIHDA